MQNRRYLGWLIAGAYATPQGGFRAPDATAPTAWRAADLAVPDHVVEARPGSALFVTDAAHASQAGHRPITAEGRRRSRAR